MTFIQTAERYFSIDRYVAGSAVDVGDDVLVDRRPRPEEFTGLAVQRVDDAGLSRECR